MRPKLLAALLGPSREPYWKHAFRGACKEIFFLTTLDRAPSFADAAIRLASDESYSRADVGVYIQPLHQGVCCHCEFQLPYAPENQDEASIAQRLSDRLADDCARQGAFFSRPYGDWAKLAFSPEDANTTLLRRVKRLFDPNDIMNSAKLCFQGPQ